MKTSDGTLLFFLPLPEDVTKNPPNLRDAAADRTSSMPWRLTTSIAWPCSTSHGYRPCLCRPMPFSRRASPTTPSSALQCLSVEIEGDEKVKHTCNFFQCIGMVLFIKEWMKIYCSHCGLGKMRPPSSFLCPLAVHHHDRKEKERERESTIYTLCNGIRLSFISV